jgi:hypothetical protein
LSHNPNINAAASFAGKPHRLLIVHFAASGLGSNLPGEVSAMESNMPHLLVKTTIVVVTLGLFGGIAEANAMPRLPQAGLSTQTLSVYYRHRYGGYGYRNYGYNNYGYRNYGYRNYGYGGYGRGYYGGYGQGCGGGYY